MCWLCSIRFVCACVCVARTQTKIAKVSEQKGKEKNKSNFTKECKNQSINKSNKQSTRCSLLPLRSLHSFVLSFCCFKQRKFEFAFTTIDFFSLVFVATANSCLHCDGKWMPKCTWARARSSIEARRTFFFHLFRLFVDKSLTTFSHV